MVYLYGKDGDDMNYIYESDHIGFVKINIEIGVEYEV